MRRTEESTHVMTEVPAAAVLPDLNGWPEVCWILPDGGSLAAGGQGDEIPLGVSAD